MPSRRQNTISEQLEAVTEAIPVTPVKRGRKTKYQTDEERRAARREQNRNYRERKKQELVTLRRSAAKADLTETS